MIEKRLRKKRRKIGDYSGEKGKRTLVKKIDAETLYT